MGLEARAALLVDGGEIATGRALLETDELFFRPTGARLRIPLATIRGASAEGARLRIQRDEGALVLDLEGPAQRWVDRILRPRSLLDRMGLRAGQRVRIAGVTDEPFLRDARQALAVVDDAVAPIDVLILQIEDPGGLAGMGAAIGPVPPAATWLITPRGRAGLGDTAVLGAGRAHGLVDTRVARFSATHTATRFSRRRVGRAASAPSQVRFT